MATPRIATSAEQPINRHAGTAKYQGADAELVGLDSNGEVVQADAQASANGGAEVPAIGVLLTSVDDGSNYTAEIVKNVIDANRTTPGDRVTFIHYGIEIENEDEDWSFTPGEKVYLDTGGGFTQTAPSTAGDIVQVVGVALTAERIMLDVDHDYSNA